MLGRIGRTVVVVAAVGVFGTGSVRADVIYANNPSPGDSYTNAGVSNQGQAVGATGWFYNNVRNNGTVGINDTYARSGNGSVYFEGGSASSKADIEYLAGGVNLLGNFVAANTLGSFASFIGMSYDWYRDSSSTASSHLHPALRILLDADGNLSTLNDRGGLVFERIYNGGGAAPTSSWVSDSVDSNSFLWNFGLGIGNEANINATAYAFDATLAEWKSYFPNAVILGFSSGIGSGWGPFVGAVDNIGWQIGTAPSTTFNFEVQSVPEPATLLLLGVGMVAGGRRFRRR